MRHSPIPEQELQLASPARATLDSPQTEVSAPGILLKHIRIDSDDDDVRVKRVKHVAHNSEDTELLVPEPDLDIGDYDSDPGRNEDSDKDYPEDCEENLLPRMMMKSKYRDLKSIFLKSHLPNFTSLLTTGVDGHTIHPMQ
jgi:hypothetical protein